MLFPSVLTRMCKIESGEKGGPGRCRQAPGKPWRYRMGQDSGSRDGSVEELDRAELDALLDSTEKLEEHAVMTGPIRLLRRTGEDSGGTLVVVEQAQDGTILARQFDSLIAARGFILGRLEQYERMWDGCGCKIDYFD